jgi:hypothetical protein
LTASTGTGHASGVGSGCLKLLGLALGVALALALVACAGEEAAPLALGERVPTEADAPGSKPDHVEKRVTANSADELVSSLHDRLINPTPEELREFKEELGFIAGVFDTRFFGAEHSADAPHVFSLVGQFDSEEHATRAAELLHNDGIRPCPETCATQVEEFDVDGVPDATGVRRFATAEDIEAAGTPDVRPHDFYTIRFSNGAFAYDIELFGPPGAVSEAQAEDIAEALYERVKGAPAPE